MSEVVKYPDEKLDEYDDNGTMVESKEALAKAVVGHKIVRAEKAQFPGRWGHLSEHFVITLDNGYQVAMDGTGDCCAYTDLHSFLLHVDKIDHVITGVGTTDEYNTWHIYADLGDVLELQVGWSCGNPFYYGYGFNIQVRDQFGAPGIEA